MLGCLPAFLLRIDIAIAQCRLMAVPLLVSMGITAAPCRPEKNDRELTIYRSSQRAPWLLFLVVL
ncbi:MAG: hypothetical protein ACI9WS_002832 [Paraglaciecola psychrophila]|jgi:hypothetical protein